MRRGIWILALGLALSAPARAEEGMFFFSQLDRLPWQELRGAGATLDAKAVNALEPAVVQVAGHGTGSFVSAQGLIVTNHHVAYGCIARLDATKEHKGIMERGYLARSRERELPCPGYYVLVVQRVSDVTGRVRAVFRRRLSPAKRYVALLERMRRIEKECEKRGGPGTVCEVKPANGGAIYTLSVYRRLRDIRLVYAPPEALGKFGGDVDNWRYPRHTLDFTFLRAYVGRDGRPAPYSAENVPFRPAQYLRISTKGIKRGDPVLVLGFPGRTMRHATAYQATYYRKVSVPFKRKLLSAILAALPKSGDSGRRYQGLAWAVSNAVKYYGDFAKQFDRFRILEAKERQQAAWAAKLAREPSLARWRRLLTRIDAMYRKLEASSQRINLSRYAASRLCRALRTAVDIVRWSKLKKVPDSRREQERYRDKNIYKVYEDSANLERFTDLEGEARILAAVMEQASRLTGTQRLKTYDWFSKWTRRHLERLKKRAARRKLSYEAMFRKETGLDPTGDTIRDGAVLLLARSRIYGGAPKPTRAARKALALRKKMFRWSAGRIRRHRDPLLQLAVHLVAELDELRHGPLAELVEVYGPELWPALVNKVIRPAYYDANFTPRVSYGFVRDYTDSETGKRWRYVSRLTWLVRKDRGKSPFLVPQKLKDIYARRDFGPWVDRNIQDVPINFTATLDTTGGNSGSPVIDGRGRLVGLLFDGTPESIVSDWYYLPGKQRSICVDIRAVLFLADKYDRATELLQELGIGTR